MSLVVGCPIRDRDWILPYWFDHLERAVRRANQKDVVLLMVGDQETEQRAFDLAEHFTSIAGWHFQPTHVSEGLGPYQREWDHQRYVHMVMLRNRLLAEVRLYEPDLFWSLDSDILVAELALEYAIEAIDTRDFDAVGQRCYMTTDGTWCPSYAMLTNGGLLRHDSPGTFLVDVIMASKVMLPKAYHVDYEVHEQGEDIGWSKAARAQGCHLGWDGRSVSKHVMSPHFLDIIDERCGF